MPRGVQHQEEFDRIAQKEYNVALHQTDMFGPQERFEQKSQVSNPTNSGGINRATKGMGSSGPKYGKYKNAHSR